MSAAGLASLREKRTPERVKRAQAHMETVILRDGSIAAKLPLSGGLFALVDIEDYPRVAGIPWYAVRARQNRENFYVQSHRDRPILLHRLIWGALAAGIQIDHIDGDGLNNTRLNLREATPSQNSASVHGFRLPRSGYRGVSYRPEKKFYEAIVTVGRQYVWRKTFKCPVEAARARDAVALQHFGEFAILNFPIHEGSME